jgi:transposase
VVEPLYQRMAERVRKSHVVATDDTVQPMLSPGQTQPARLWVYVGDEANPYNVFDFTLNRSREGPKEFLKDYTQVLLADAYGGYNGWWPVTPSLARDVGRMRDASSWRRRNRRRRSRARRSP